MCFHTPLRSCTLLLSCLLAAATVGEEKVQLDAYDHLSFAHPEAVLQVDPIVYQALPGVYRVNVFGTIHATCPAEVAVDFGKVKAALAEAKKNGKVLEGISDGLASWLIVAAAPEKFFTPSKERVTYELKEEGYLWYGSCYLIDRNGVCVTNRHVVDGGPPEALMVGESTRLPIVNLAKLLHAEFGDLDDRQADQFVLARLFAWFASHSTQTSHVTRLQVAVAYSAKTYAEQSNEELAANITSKLFVPTFDERRPVFLPADVMRIVPGEETNHDVALIYIEGVNDALIGLPLADPAAVREGKEIYSLGFPGYRYDSVKRESRDFYSANMQKGSIVWTAKDTPVPRELEHLWVLRIPEARKLTIINARIGSGASGGPVILRDGSVAAMNVLGYFRKNEPPVDSYLAAEGAKATFGAVPLENIRAVLDELKLKPELGPTTADWRAAVTAYQKQDYTTAIAKLQTIQMRQHYKPNLGKPFARDASQDKQIPSHYVVELLQLAEMKSKK